MDPGEILLYEPVAFPGSEEFDEICRRIVQQPEPVRELLDFDEVPDRSAAA